MDFWERDSRKVSLATARKHFSFTFSSQNVLTPIVVRSRNEVVTMTVRGRSNKNDRASKLRKRILSNVWTYEVKNEQTLLKDVQY